MSSNIELKINSQIRIQVNTG